MLGTNYHCLYLYLKERERKKEKIQNSDLKPSLPQTKKPVILVIKKGRLKWFGHVESEDVVDWASIV